MIKFAILFALVASAAASYLTRLNPLSPSGRIVGGSATTIEQVPYQASVQIFDSHYCGGTIISETWILTAAHCLIFPNYWYTVRTGSTRSNSGGSVIWSSGGIVHKNYTTTAQGVPVNDIALIRLRSALILDSSRAPIPLYSAGEEAVVGSSGIITGWCAVREGGSYRIFLQTATIPIVSKADCDAAYASFGGLADGQICAALPTGGRDACQGDSGGPLAIAGRLAGIISWGNGCARRGFPGVYTEVAAYRSWIAVNSGV